MADATLAICLLAFLAKSAEDIVKRIFGFQAQSMASPVAAAALGYINLLKNFVAVQMEKHQKYHKIITEMEVQVQQHHQELAKTIFKQQIAINKILITMQPTELTQLIQQT